MQDLAGPAHSRNPVRDPSWLWRWGVPKQVVPAVAVRAQTLLTTIAPAGHAAWRSQGPTPAEESSCRDAESAGPQNRPHAGKIQGGGRGSPARSTDRLSDYLARVGQTRYALTSAGACHHSVLSAEMRSNPMLLVTLPVQQVQELELTEARLSLHTCAPGSTTGAYCRDTRGPEWLGSFWVGSGELQELLQELYTGNQELQEAAEVRYAPL